MVVRLSSLSPKIWKLIPDSLKEETSFSSFHSKTKSRRERLTNARPDSVRNM